MDELDFAQALPESASPEELDKVAPSLLRYLISSGDNSYRDGVDGFRPEPSQANNWLYDTEDEAFKGRFYDRRPGQSDRVFEFTISKVGKDWLRVFKPISGVEDDEDDTEDFAEIPNNALPITNKSALALLKRLIDSVYLAGITAIKYAYVDADDNIRCGFEDKISANKTLSFDGKFNSTLISYGISNTALSEWDEPNSVISFAAPATIKPRNCNPAKSFQCGNSCQQLGRNCKKSPNPGQQGAIAKIIETAKKLGKKSNLEVPLVGGGASNTLISNPKNYQEYISNGKILADDFIVKASSYKDRFDSLENSEIDFESERSSAISQTSLKIARDNDKTLATTEKKLSELVAIQKQLGDDYRSGKLTMVEFKKKSQPNTSKMEPLHQKMFAAQQAYEAQAKSDVDNSPEFKSRSSLLGKERTSLEAESGQLLKKLTSESSLSDAEVSTIVGGISVKPQVEKENPNIRTELADYAKLVNGKGLSYVKNINYTDGRASTFPGTGVMLYNGKEKRALMHELAHQIEFESEDIGKNSMDWVKSRSSGKPKKLSQLTDEAYRPDEIAYPDKFVDPYVGKVYRENRKDLPISEVISFGVEHFSDPRRMAEFASIDPDHFAYTLGVMKS